MSDVSFDYTVLPVSANTTEGVCLIVGLAMGDKFAFGEDPIVGMNVFQLAVIPCGVLFISDFRL